MPDIPNLYAYNNFAIEFNGKHPNKLSKMKYMFWFFLFLKNLQMYSYSHLMAIYSSLCSLNGS